MSNKVNKQFLIIIAILVSCLTNGISCLLVNKDHIFPLDCPLSGSLGATLSTINGQSNTVTMSMTVCCVCENCKIGNFACRCWDGTQGH